MKTHKDLDIHASTHQPINSSTHSLTHPSTHSDVAIKVDHVSKKYCKSLNRSMLYGVRDIGRNMLGLSSHSEKLRKDEFWAVDDISFEVKKGETLGIIGPNGSGKTTLLKMLNGIFWPDNGKITVKGRIGALIEVGAGFHPLLTGRENVYINAAILGMIKEEVDEKFDSIVEFADIGDFINTPVKFYSSGMFVRLGFAVAVHCEPDILLVDEVLAVGDYNFQAKCFNKIGHLKKQGATIILVTHNMHIASRYCKKAVVLNRGKMIYSGNAENAIESYYDLCSPSDNGQVEKILTKSDFFEVTNVNFIPNQKLNPNDSLEIEIDYFSKKLFKNVNVNLGMYYGNSLVFHVSNHTFGKIINIGKGKGKLLIKIKNMSFNYITVYVVISIWTSDNEEVLFLWRNIPLRFSKKANSRGESHFVTDFKIIG